MRTNKTKSYLMVFLLASVVSTPLAAKSKKKLLNRSVYMPIDFKLCEHLGEGILYENDRPMSKMPAGRLFQFTYYAEREVLLPEQVRVRVNGKYLADDEPFTAKLSVTVQGIHTAHRFRSAKTKVQLQKQRKKIDTRLEKRTIRLACKRFANGSAKLRRRDRTGERAWSLGSSIKQTSEFLAIVVGQLASDADDMKDFDHPLLRLTHGEHAVALGRLQEYVERLRVAAVRREHLAKLHHRARVLGIRCESFTKFLFARLQSNVAERELRLQLIYPFGVRAGCWLEFFHYRLRLLTLAAPGQYLGEADTGTDMTIVHFECSQIKRLRLLRR